MSKNKETIKVKNTFFASCPVGIEQVLEKELQSIGIKKTILAKGGVTFESFPQIALKAILYSKLASRIFKVLFTFEIKNEDDLYYRSKEIKWKAVFNVDQSFKIQTIQGNSPDNQKRSKFKSSIFLSQRFKDGIVDSFRDLLNKRPDVDTTSPDASLVLRITPHDNEFSTKEDVSVLIDLCGMPISNRGYRMRGFAAPLRENLAAGIVAMTNFKDNNFLDLMTGSGTLAIEAALYKASIPGGYLQIQDFFDHGDEFTYNFLTLNFFTKDELLQKDWSSIVDSAYEEIKESFKSLKDSKTKIYANDNDKRTRKLLQDNVNNALLGDVIELLSEDALELKLELSNTTIVANPPYGERLGEDQDLTKLYHELGEHLKNNYRNCNAYIFTGNMPLIKKISLQTSKRIILFNGNIESRLVEYKLY